MIIRLSDPAATSALVSALSARVHYVVEQRSDAEVAVSVLGSFADGGEMELALFLAACQRAHPDVTLELSSA